MFSHKQRTGIVQPSFVVGDYVLVSQMHPRGHKLQFQWRGPLRVTKSTSKWTYEVTNLLHGKREIVHARRMLPYRSSLRETPASQKLVEASSNLDREYQVAHPHVAIKESKGDLFVKVRWEGRPDDVEHTWERLRYLTEDLPGMLEDFLHTSGVGILKRQALAQASF